MSRISKSIEKESRLAVAGAGAWQQGWWGYWEKRGVTVDVYGVSFWGV